VAAVVVSALMQVSELVLVAAVLVLVPFKAAQAVAAAVVATPMAVSARAPAAATATSVAVPAAPEPAAYPAPKPPAPALTPPPKLWYVFLFLEDCPNSLGHLKIT
jgi:hypothetical protein